jgi:hypothetical protein
MLVLKQHWGCLNENSIWPYRLSFKVLRKITRNFELSDTIRFGERQSVNAAQDFNIGTDKVPVYMECPIRNAAILIPESLIMILAPSQVLPGCFHLAVTVYWGLKHLWIMAEPALIMFWRAVNNHLKRMEAHQWRCNVEITWCVASEGLSRQDWNNSQTLKYSRKSFICIFVILLWNRYQFLLNFNLGNVF